MEQGALRIEDAKNADGSPDRFGYEWGTYARILPESRAQLQRWLGSLPLEDFRGKTVMDVGCGMGRNSYWIAQAGAAVVLAVDLDERSLEAAARNLAELPSAKVVKRSVYELDSAMGSFDRVVCIGVLHHLSDPEDALRRMWDRVSDGGQLILWCYAREGNRLLLPMIQAARLIGSKLPIRMTHSLARALTAFIWPMIRVLPWRTSYYANLRQLSFINVESIVFDQMLPQIANYWSRDDMIRLLDPLKGSVHIEFVQGNSWHARVTKTPGR